MRHLRRRQRRERDMLLGPGRHGNALWNSSCGRGGGRRGLQLSDRVRCAKSRAEGRHPFLSLRVPITEAACATSLHAMIMPFLWILHLCYQSAIQTRTARHSIAEHSTAQHRTEQNTTAHHSTQAAVRQGPAEHAKLLAALGTESSRTGGCTTRRGTCAASVGLFLLLDGGFTVHLQPRSPLSVRL